MATNQNKKSNKVTNNDMNSQVQKALETYNKDLELFIKNFDVPLLVYVLKNTSNWEEARSVKDICADLNLVVPNGTDPFFSERTLRRRFDLFDTIDNPNVSNIAIDQIKALLPYIYGGSISSREADGIAFGKNTTDKGSQRRYYFDPILTDGDMDTIIGTIQSNRYLSDLEKEYLISRLKVLFPTYQLNKAGIEAKKNMDIRLIDALPKKPDTRHGATLPMDTSTFLKNVQILHEAIMNQWQIEVQYGIYDQNDAGDLTFHNRNVDEPYILNPYGLAWNRGNYYLIATRDKYKTPNHFRVDRIISVKPLEIENKDGNIEFVPRKATPAILKPYIIHLPEKYDTFDAIKYVNTYPKFAIFEEDNKIKTLTFECTPQSLSILVDAFGTDIKLDDSPVNHSKTEFDRNGQEIHYLKATVKNIQYDNALLFALSHPEQITVLEPHELVEDIHKKLVDITNKYKNLL